jgi:hypothetical protein
VSVASIPAKVVCTCDRCGERIEWTQANPVQPSYAVPTSFGWRRLATGSGAYDLCVKCGDAFTNFLEHPEGAV